MRPFAQTSNTVTQEKLVPPDLQAQVERASRFGHSFGKLAIQPKLTIGEPGDKYEQEADRVAAQVVQRINQPEAVSAKQEENIQRIEKPEKSEIQMKSLVQRREAIGGGEASTDLESAINNAKGGGQALDAGLQRSMGQAMGADFSGVRVHTDAQSDQLNKSIQAKAFTTGQDVFFRQGAYEPRSRGGQELIAHELTHVEQQKKEGEKVGQEKQEKERESIGERERNGKREERQNRKDGCKREEETKKVTKKTKEEGKGKAIQRMLYLNGGAGERSREATQSEIDIIIEYIDKNEKTLRTSGIDVEAIVGYIYDPEADGLMSYRHSIAGSHGFEITGIDVHEPTLNKSGNGNLEIDKNDHEEWRKGIEINGRPGWTEEIAKAISTVKGKQNIRHILPWHTIREGMEYFVNRHLASPEEGGVEELDKRLVAVRLKISGDGTVELDIYKRIVENIVEILTLMNSKIENLWAGSAEVNQRINTLRTVTQTLSRKLKKGSINREGVIKHLKTLENNATKSTYKQLLTELNEILPVCTNEESMIELLTQAGGTYELDLPDDVSVSKEKFQVLQKCYLGMKSMDFDNLAISFMQMTT
ncbi:MAG: DUF4157 domain-containing protein [Nostoc sp. LPT]|nr:DUF4157 domain-containing protein [Nostoc sp. LPT]